MTSDAARETPVLGSPADGTPWAPPAAPPAGVRGRAAELLRRRSVSVSLRIVVGLLLLAGLLWGAGSDNVLHHLQRLDPVWIALAALLYGASLAVRGLRLWVLLLPENPRASWGTITCASTLGWSLNNFLPFRLGDLIRLYLIGARAEVSLGSVLIALVAERLLDIAVLVLATAIGSSSHLTGLGGGLVMVAALVVAATMGLFALRLAPRWGRSLFGGRPLPGRLAPFADRLARLAGSAQVAARMHLTGWGVVRLLALTLGAWGLQFLQYATFFRAFGIDPDMMLLAAFAAFMLSFAINFVPGQVGTYEALFVGIFSAAGIGTPDLLLAVGLATHVVNGALLSLFGGISYLFLGVKRGELQALARRAKPSAVMTEA